MKRPIEHPTLSDLANALEKLADRIRADAKRRARAR